MRDTVVAYGLGILASGLSGTAIYLIYTAETLSLPIPILASLLSGILPVLNYATIFPTYRQSVGSQERRYFTLFHKSRFPLPSLPTLLWALSILDTILVTVTTTAYDPQALSCVLPQRWSQLYRAKDEGAIRAIQDRYRCCGFRTPRDMPWPFPGGPDRIDPSTCVNRYGWTEACEELWGHSERVVLGFMIAVGVVGLISKIIIVVLMHIHPEWFGGQYRSMRYETVPQTRRIAQEAEEIDEEAAPAVESYSDEPHRLEEGDRNGDARSLEGVWRAE